MFFPYKRYYVDKLPLVAIVIFFVVNPLFGILLSAFLVARSHNYDLIKIVAFMAILYLAALNTTKTIENDMIDYIEQYVNVPSLGYFKTLSFLYDGNYIKDPGYGTLVYILHYLTFGNYHFFVAVITFLTYGFMFAAFIKFGKEYKLPIYIVVSQILLLSFFTQYFSLSVQLIRQQLATAIFFYALTYRMTSKYKYFFFCVISLLIHSSSMITIVLLSLIPALKKRLPLKWILIMILFSMSVFALFSSIATVIVENFVLGNDQIGRGIGRMAEIEGTQDRGDGLDPMLGMVFSILFIGLSLFETIRKSKMVYPIVVNICFVWSLVVISASISPVLQYRLFFIMYSLLPFIIFLLLRENHFPSMLFCMCVVIFFIIRFYSNLNNAFHYTDIDNALLSPYFFLIQL